MRRSPFHRLRLLVRRAGIDISRFPGFDPAHMLVRLLKVHNIDVVLDVGANSGQFAGELRRAGYQGRMVSFEPLSGPFAALQREASHDRDWHVHQTALGDIDGSTTIHVAGNDGLSSSLLPMTSTQLDVYPDSAYVASEDVSIRRLDSIIGEVSGPGDRVFLKIDVQGLEPAVLAGARDTVRERCIGLQVELAFVQLYEGAPLVREVVDVLEGQGFELMRIVPGFTDPRSGRMLEADGIFFRSDEANRAIAVSTDT